MTMWSLVNALLLWGATQSFDAREIARFPRSLISYVTRPVLASEDVANRQNDPVVKQAINAMLSELKRSLQAIYRVILYHQLPLQKSLQP